MDHLQEAVRERYKSKALQMAAAQAASCDTGACCDEGSSCGEGYCEAADRTTARSEDYKREELATVGLTPEQSLGCGNPTLLADLRPGETVLDLEPQLRREDERWMSREAATSVPGRRYPHERTLLPRACGLLPRAGGRPALLLAP